jgi:hypothetical protein
MLSVVGITFRPKLLTKAASQSEFQVSETLDVPKTRKLSDIRHTFEIKYGDQIITVDACDRETALAEAYTWTYVAGLEGRLRRSCATRTSNPIYYLQL